MTRPSRDKLLMESAWVWSKRGTCSRAQVGSVFSRDGRILVQGYNGSPAGLPHCWHDKDAPCTTAVHAESNGIAFAAKHGVVLEGAHLHTTRIPCTGCAMLVINAGIARVVYQEDHRDMNGLALLRTANVAVISYDRIAT